MIPVGFVAGPEDIAESLYFAVTNRHTTGTILDTSGGLQLGRTMDSNHKVGFGAQAQRPRVEQYAEPARRSLHTQFAQ